MKQKNGFKERITEANMDVKRKKKGDLVSNVSWKFYEVLKGLQPLIISGMGVGVTASLEPGWVVMFLIYGVWAMGALGYFIRLLFPED